MQGLTLPDWQRAHGPSLFSAQLRLHPEDFQVTEELGWEASGDGEHDLLFVEKTTANTDWVARQLASHAGVELKEIGYAGLKDRHAITRQWFSIPRWHAPDWSTLDVTGVSVLQVHRHRRKLRRGAHKTNSFRIVLRTPDAVKGSLLDQRIETLRRSGVPNYFGEQRFGRDANNLALADALAAGRRLPRQKRGLAISTIRAYAFNQALSARVAAGSWNQLVPGKRANLDGTGSVFDIDEVDETLTQRCDALDIHPAGQLAGKGTQIQPEHWQVALDRKSVEPGERGLRVRVQEPSIESHPSGWIIGFTLGRGSYATAVLRELCTWSIQTP